MLFGDLLRTHGFAPERTAVALHKPADMLARRVLAELAEYEPQMLNWYQSTHTRMQEATLRARDHLASFILKDEGSFVFCGMFQNNGNTIMSAADLDALPQFQRLQARLGEWTFSSEAAQKGVAGRALFDLTPMEAMSDLVGRLVIADPGPRNYMRKAENTPLEVLEVTRAIDLSPDMPDWRVLTFTKEDIRTCPRAWRIRLAEWRGIYLITDQSDGARYVGSASGATNFWGRWTQHVNGEAGVTVELRKRDPAQFRFSILERVSPDMLADKVIKLEHTWMTRLDTVAFGLNH